MSRLEHPTPFSDVVDFERRHLLSDAHYGTLLQAIPLLYGTMWLIGLGGLFWPLFAIPSAVYIADRQVTRLALAPLVTCTLLVVSIPIGVIAYSQTERSVGALGNAAVWLCAAAMLVFTDRRGSRVEAALLVARVGAFQGVVVGLGLLSYPSSAPVPLGVMPASVLPSGLDTFASSQIVYDDWLGGAALRTVGIMANPTWAGAFAVITLGACAQLLILRKHRFLALFTAAGAFVTIALSLSRATIILGIVALLLGVINAVRSRSRQFSNLMSLALLGLILIILFLNWADLLEAALDLNSDRAGSWESRANIYVATLDGIREHPLIFLGYGIKPQVPGLVASVATHSSFLSILFRAGILGLLSLVVFAVSLVLNRWRDNDPIGIFIVLFIFSWGMLEDLDGGHLLFLGLLLAQSAGSKGGAREARGRGVAGYGALPNAPPPGWWSASDRQSEKDSLDPPSNPRWARRP